MNPLVSIIVPIYNSENYLERCISSILRQTFNDYEIILIDDGSNDNSGNICDKFAKEDMRFIVKHVANSGVSNARNIGLNLAAGKYIAFIDSDDYIEPNYIMELYNNLINNEADLSICSVEIVNDKSNYKWDVGTAILDFNNLDKSLFLKLNETYLLYGPVNKLFVNKIIQKNNIRFDINNSYGEDLIFNFQYCRYVKKISIIDKVSYYYVQDNDESLSKKYNYNKMEISKKIHFTLLNFFNYVNITDNRAYQFLYNRLFDDIYNSLFLINNPRFSKGIFSTIKYVKSIFKDKELDDCLRYADTSIYSKNIVTIIKHKSISMFLVFAFIARLNYKLKKWLI